MLSMLLDIAIKGTFRSFTKKSNKQTEKGQKKKWVIKILLINMVD